MSRPVERHLDARPIIKLIDRFCNLADMPPTSRRAYWRARRTGQITIRQADHLAVEQLNMHPSEIWGMDTWATL